MPTIKTTVTKTLVVNINTDTLLLLMDGKPNEVALEVKIVMDGGDINLHNCLLDYDKLSRAYALLSKNDPYKKEFL